MPVPDQEPAEGAHSPMPESDGFVAWMFRSRQTGRITLLQVPNAPLTVWLLASAGARLGVLGVRGGAVLGVVAAVALALWAAIEVVSGVNPFRRLLGLVVLVWVISTRLGIG